MFRPPLRIESRYLPEGESNRQPEEHSRREFHHQSKSGLRFPPRDHSQQP
jgi:hypothetical protein